MSSENCLKKKDANHCRVEDVNSPVISLQGNNVGGYLVFRPKLTLENMTTEMRVREREREGENVNELNEGEYENITTPSTSALCQRPLQCHAVTLGKLAVLAKR